MQKQIRERYNHLSIRYKIIIMMLIVAIIPLFIFASVTTSLYQYAIQQRSERHIEQNIAIMSEQIEAVFDDGELCANNLVINISNILNSVDSEQGQYNQIYSQMAQSILIFEGIQSIVYLDNRGEYLTTSGKLLDSEEVVKNSQYVKELGQLGGQTVLFDMENNCMQVDKNSKIITVGKRVINTLTGKPVGFIFINFEIDYVSQFMKNDITEFILFDSIGDVVVDYTVANIKDKQELQNLNEEVDFINHKYLGASKELIGYGWKLVGLTNLNQFNITGWELFGMLCGTGIVIVLLIWGVSNRIATLITTPLITLRNGAKIVSEGDFTVRVTVPSYDEIGELSHSFNVMAEQVEALITRVNDEAKKKREYELALVHEQVKPHFLYNTLDIVIVLIEMNRSKDAHYVTKKLANYYRNTLSNRKEYLSVEQEFKILEDYLELQMMRYGKQFTYTIQMEEAAEKSIIPRMTLQPIVENALYHGLKYKKNWGQIKVYTKVCNQDLCIYVEDDGIGMTEEKLHSVLENEDGDIKSFGIFSVDTRLKLYYGESYGIHITSEYEKGTIVMVKIPMGNEVGDTDDENNDRR